MFVPLNRNRCMTDMTKARLDMDYIDVAHEKAPHSYS